MAQYLYLVDPGLYVSGNVPNEFFTSAQYKPANKDLFRMRTGKFYNGEVNYPESTDYKIYELGNFNGNTTPPTFEFAASTESPLFAGPATDLTTQNFKNSLNPDFATDDNPRNIIGTFPLEQEFTDHVTRYELPSPDATINAPRASIDLNYNFYQKAYEFATTQLPVSESLLPSFYALTTELEYGVTGPTLAQQTQAALASTSLPQPEKNEKTFAHLTLDDYDFPSGKSFKLFELINSPSGIGRPEYFVEDGNYFDEYAEAINNINNSTQASLSEGAFGFLADSYQ